MSLVPGVSTEVSQSLLHTLLWKQIPLMNQLLSNTVGTKVPLLLGQMFPVCVFLAPDTVQCRNIHNTSEFPLISGNSHSHQSTGLHLCAVSPRA